MMWCSPSATMPESGSWLFRAPAEAWWQPGDPTDRLLGWRQLIAVGPLGPDGGTEIAEILHPSTDGSVRFLKRNGPGLDVVAQKVGYRSHEFGTRNLEQALVVDADRDGHPEVVVPTLDRQSMAGVRHAPEWGGGDVGSPSGGDAGHQHRRSHPSRRYLIPRSRNPGRFAAYMAMSTWLSGSAYMAMSTWVSGSAYMAVSTWVSGSAYMAVSTWLSGSFPS